MIFIEVLFSVPNTLWALPKTCLVLALLQLCPFSHSQNGQGQGHEPVQSAHHPHGSLGLPGQTAQSACPSRTHKSLFLCVISESRSHSRGCTQVSRVGFGGCGHLDMQAQAHTPLCARPSLCGQSRRWKADSQCHWVNAVLPAGHQLETHTLAPLGS